MCLRSRRKPVTYKPLPHFTGYKIKMLKDRGSGRQVVIIHRSYRQTEILQLIIAGVETRQHGVIVIYPAFHIVLHVKVHHPRAADRDIIGIRHNLYIRVMT
jgi:hypothetical protein